MWYVWLLSVSWSFGMYLKNLLTPLLWDLNTVTLGWRTLQSLSWITSQILGLTEVSGFESYKKEFCESQSSRQGVDLLGIGHLWRIPGGRQGCSLWESRHTWRDTHSIDRAKSLLKGERSRRYHTLYTECGPPQKARSPKVWRAVGFYGVSNFIGW